MIKIYIFADSHKHFKDAVLEYLKRLWKSLELIELKPVKKWTPEQIIDSESKILIDKLSKESWYKIILSPNGKNISTEKFWEIIETQKNSWNKIIFAIWWANWLDYNVLKNAIDLELSLWKMILPHSLALTVLLEQVYRCSEIERGSSYHK
jgi:23S rRNA (pseudouridine1915-N3)-methyltransferase